MKEAVSSGHVTVEPMASGHPDEREFRRLFDDAYRPLLAYARRRTASAADAEEIVSETLLIAWRRRRHELPADDALPWLYGVARRVLANQRRGRERFRRLGRALAGSAPPLPDAVEQAEAREGARAVLAALARLPERDREVLRLAFWEQLPHEQIAVVLGCSANAAALRLHRARLRLREELMKEGRAAGQEVVEVIR